MRWQTQVKCALATVLCVITGAAVLVPPPAEAADTAAYISFAAPLAQQEYARYGVPASVAIAQSILESGWGGSGLTKEANSYFGIKCPASGNPAATGSPHVTGCVAKDSYEYPGPVIVRSYFRAYGSAQSSFLDHGLLLRSRSWYAPAFAYTTDPDQFIREVAKGGYATDPGYADLVIRIMRQYNLYRFDPARPTPTPTPIATPTATASAKPTVVPTTAAPIVTPPPPAPTKETTAPVPVAPVVTTAAPTVRPTPPPAAPTTTRPVSTPPVAPTTRTTTTRPPATTGSRSATVTPSPAATRSTAALPSQFPQPTAAVPVAPTASAVSGLESGRLPSLVRSGIEQPIAIGSLRIAWLH